MKNIVLLVDDDDNIVDLLSALFLQNDWLPERANCASEGLVCASRALPTVVICDLQMPGMSGFEFAGQMRQMYGARCPRLIAFSGWPEHDIAQLALAAGFDTLIRKPAEFARIFEAATSVSRTMQLSVNDAT
ncbi:response regulator [Duganella sp. Root1480D1]|uniref:response regulator n=1 Tax=Duganella sp. Root1480D1 TaxID=1736471 RepID=UPI0012E3E8A2|nr:response regulator [Duganella sp. Root1480D1]